MNENNCGSISLRDYFAAHAPPPPTGWIGSSGDRSTNLVNTFSHQDDDICRDIEWRWFWADEMISIRETNRSLHSVAPELLVTLQAIASIIGNVDHEASSSSNEGRYMGGTLNSIRAISLNAISKAMGETS